MSAMRLLLLSLLWMAACKHGSGETTQAPGSVQAVVRYPGGARLKVRLDAHGGLVTAEVATRGGELPESASRAAIARAWLLVAARAEQSGDHREAIAAARAGLAELGDAYEDDRFEDDTDLKVKAADASRGASEEAVLLRNVLESRLLIYQSKHEATALGFEPALE